MTATVDRQHSGLWSLPGSMPDPEEVDTPSTASTPMAPTRWMPPPVDTQPAAASPSPSSFSQRRPTALSIPPLAPPSWSAPSPRSTSSAPSAATVAKVDLSTERFDRTPGMYFTEVRKLQILENFQSRKLGSSDVVGVTFTPDQGQGYAEEPLVFRLGKLGKWRVTWQRPKGAPLTVAGTLKVEYKMWKSKNSYKGEVAELNGTDLMLTSKYKMWKNKNSYKGEVAELNETEPFHCELGLSSAACCIVS